MTVMRADRYIESFPRVGIVIPNPAIWLLPQFQDLAATLSTTLSLPNLLPHGAFAEPTSDGFLLWLPSGTCLSLRKSFSIRPAARFHPLVAVRERHAAVTALLYRGIWYRALRSLPSNAPLRLAWSAV